jgi:maltose O-acetyltransferase
MHPMDHKERATGLEFAKPITIGEDVWIGGSVVICPGVTIGHRSVIGAGSVVTKDIPADVVAVGNPCKVIRSLTE